jgi:hypothetical protein
MMSTVLPSIIEPTIPAMSSDIGEPGEWPSLQPQEDTSTITTTTTATTTTTPKQHDEWEMVPEVQFDGEAQSSLAVHNGNPLTMKHYPSSPNLLCCEIEEDGEEDSAEDDCDSSAVFIDHSNINKEDDESTFSMISSPPSVTSASTWETNKASFASILLSPAKSKPEGTSSPTTTTPTKLRKVKPKFVVTPIKRCTKSTGDLQRLGALAEEDVLGDTDAHEYYDRKAHGYAGRQNGLKTRPDEAKRLQITMAKKTLQRERQGIA